MQRIKPFEVNVEVNKKKVNFDKDTGCSVSIVNEKKFNEMREENKCPKLNESKPFLKSYLEEKIKIVVVSDVKGNYAQQMKTLSLVVVKGTGPSLLGRGWLDALKLKWDEIKHVNTEAHELHKVLLS